MFALRSMPIAADENRPSGAPGRCSRRRLPARGAGRGRLARRRRLGAAARRRPRPDRGNAAGLLPGQDRQQRRGHPLPGRGPRDRLPGRSPAASPVPTRRPSKARSSPGRSPSPSPRPRKRKRPPTRSASSTNSSARPREARIGVLRPVEGSKPPQYTLVRQSPLEVLNPYFGSTPIFALDHPLTVLQGQVVALTVPTWAPMFAFNVSAENTWRGSRLPEHCASKEDIQGGHPQQGVGKTKTYGCYYSERPPALHGDAGQEALSRWLRALPGAARSTGSR